MAGGRCSTPAQASALEPRHRGLVVRNAASASPRRLHVQRPRQTSRSLKACACALREGHLERAWHERLPLTHPAQTLLDIAGVVRFMELRRALAEAEYRRLVTLAEVEAVLGRGRPGSAALRAALDCHLPQLARTRSRMEEMLRAALRAHTRLTPPDT